MDYRREAESLERFRRIYGAGSLEADAELAGRVRAPAVLAELSTAGRRRCSRLNNTSG